MKVAEIFAGLLETPQTFVRRSDTFPVSSAMHRIAATGARVPSAIGDFSDLRETYGLSPILLQNLKNSGFTTPTAIQTMAIPILLNVGSSVKLVNEGH